MATRLAHVDLDALVFSPKRRARETAEIVRTQFPHAAVESSEHADDRTPIPTDHSSVPERYWSFLGGVPAAEHDVDGHRLDAAVDHFGSVGAHDRRVLVVTHAFVIAWFVRRALDAPPWRWLGLNHLNGAITTIDYSSDGSRLIAFNDSGHLTPISE